MYWYFAEAGESSQARRSLRVTFDLVTQPLAATQDGRIRDYIAIAMVRMLSAFRRHLWPSAFGLMCGSTDLPES